MQLCPIGPHNYWDLFLELPPNAGSSETRKDPPADQKNRYQRRKIRWRIN
jgi:hypothetical protein